MCKTEVYGNSVIATAPTPSVTAPCDSTASPPDTECIQNPTSGWANQQRKGRLLPIPEVGGSGTNTWEDGVDRENLAFIPPFENTKHRYPWICSLRYVMSKVLKFNSLILILLIGQSLITLISVAPPS